MPRTPSIVFSRIGNRQKKAMKAIFCRFSIEWRRTMEIGRSAGGGIARHHSMCGIAMMRPHLDSPSGIPRRIPRTRAIPKPAAILVRLGTTCSSNCEKSHIWRNSTRIVESRGNFGSWACTVHACHARRIATGTAISAAIAAVWYVRRLKGGSPTFDRVDRSLQTAAPAKPARPEGDIASDVSCCRRPLGRMPAQRPALEGCEEHVDREAEEARGERDRVDLDGQAER